MRKGYFLALSLLLAVTSCQDSKVSKVAFGTFSVDDVPTKETCVDTVKTGCEFVNPLSIDVLGDSALLVFDDSRGDKLCHAVKYGDSLIMSFGEKGRAATEFIYPQGATMDNGGKFCYIYDYNKCTVVRFPMHGFLAGHGNADEFINMRKLYGEGVDASSRFYRVLSLSGNRFIGFGNQPANRIQVFDKSNVLSTYSDYPVLDENEENNWSLWGNKALFGVSPDERHIVVTTDIGAAFEVLSLSGNEVKPVLARGIYQPIYSLAKGAVPPCVVANKETISGFSSLYVANDGFYAVLAGPEYRYNEILKFGFDGNCLQRYRLPEDIDYVMCMRVEGDKLLAFVEVEGGNVVRLVEARL